MRVPVAAEAWVAAADPAVREAPAAAKVAAEEAMDLVTHPR